MVRYNPKAWFTLIFHSYSRQVVKVLFPALLFMASYTAFITYFILDYFDAELHSTTVVHSLLGVVLGLFLVFRVNSAYDRWWEGRKLWGSLVNNSRNLAFKMNGFLPKDDVVSKQYFRHMIVNFVIAAREHLRKGVDITLLTPVGEDFAERLKGKQHIPNVLTAMMYEKVDQLYRNKILTDNQLLLVDREMKEFSEIMGGCERIRNTPIPYSYSMYIKKFIFTFTITLPFAFMSEFHYWTVPIVLMIFFILVSVELIAEEIEEPFGGDVNDLPTNDLSKKITENVAEILL